MALAMGLTKMIFSLPNMSLITVALWNEEPKASARAVERRFFLPPPPNCSMILLLEAHTPSLVQHILDCWMCAFSFLRLQEQHPPSYMPVMSKPAGLPCAQSLTSTSAGRVQSSSGVRPLPTYNLAAR